MSSPPPINIYGYNPYASGWYLLPVTVDSVPSPLSGLTQGQINELNAHTVQSLVEVSYVRVGNDILYKGLYGLDSALATTSQTLTTLGVVQNLHNALTVSTLGSFSAWFRFSSSAYGGATGYQSNYNSVASAFFGIPIVPDFIFTSAGATAGGETYMQYASQLAATRVALANQVSQLKALASPADLSDPNSLYNTSKQVLSDLPPLDTTAQAAGGPAIAWSDAKLWAMDFYGAYQGKDLAQVRPTQMIVTYSAGNTPEDFDNAFANTSLSPGRQLGIGAGQAQGGASVGVGSIHIDRGAIGAGQILVTYSGRMAIRFAHNSHGSGGTMRATIVKVNPIDAQGNVANPIVGNNQGANIGYLNGQAPYIGTFGGATRGQAQNAGLFQQNITLAITACQGTNNSQTQQVQALLYVFEEYYQSAASVLATITQLIKTFAQGIRPA